MVLLLLVVVEPKETVPVTPSLSSMTGARHLRATITTHYYYLVLLAREGKGKMGWWKRTTEESPRTVTIE